MALVKKAPKNLTPVEQALARYDEKASEIAALEEEHADVFEEYAKLQQELTDAEAELKRQVTAAAPAKPPIAGQKTYTQAEVGGFRVELTYSQGKPYFDPAKLPKDVLLKKGVIKAVDADIIRKLPPSMLEKCTPALVEGAWGTPRVSIKTARDGGDS